MQGLRSIAAGIAALGIGFGVGSLREARQNAAREENRTIKATAITFLGDASRGQSEKGGGLLDPIPFATYAEARERLADLMEANARLRGIHFPPPLESAKILDEIGQILALAGEEELVAFIEGCKLDVGSVPILEIAYGALARHSPPRAAALWLERWDKGSDAGLLPLIQEWEARRPREVEAWIEGLGNETLKSAALQRLLLQRAGDDPEGVLSRLAEIGPGEEGHLVAAALGKSLDLARMPQVAEELLAAGGEENSSTHLAGLLSAWGAREPGAMWEWLLAQDTDFIGPVALTGALSALAEADPEGFFGRATPELGDHPSLRRVAGMAWWKWLAQNGGETAAIRWLGEHGDLASGFEESSMGELYASGYYRHLGFDWHPQRTERILAALAEIPDSPFKSSFSQEFLKILSHSQPKAVLDYALAHLPVGSQTDDTIAAAAGRWAATGDAKATVDWCLGQLQSESTRTRALRAGMRAWASEDPRSAAEFAMGLEEKERETALRGIVSHWPNSDPEGLLSFLHRASDADAVSILTQTSFRALGRGKGNSRYLSNALEMPEGTMRHDAVRGLFEGWAAADVEEGAGAIQRVPEGPLRDSAILGLNPRASSKNPKLAFELAGRISAAATRNKELVARGRAWLGKDRKAAESAIRTHPSIPDTVKAEIFK